MQTIPFHPPRLSRLFGVILCTAVLLETSPNVIADEKPDKRASSSPKDNGKSAAKAKAGGVRIICEWIEVEHTDLTEWLLENRLTNDATPMRQWAQKHVERGEGSIVRTMITATRSGQRSKTEDSDEVIYATEYDPMRIPNEVSLDGRSEAPITLPLPTAFELRKTGGTLEVDPVVASDGSNIDINLVPAIVTLVEERKIPNGELEEDLPMTMPVFSVAKVSTSVNVANGGYALLGTVRLPKAHDTDRKDPIVLVFVRADAS